MKPIYMVGGSKGGVGKSCVSMALVDALQAREESILLVEADTSNPDVYKMYKDEVKTETINLDDANGWIDLVNVCDANPDATVVINTAARNNEGVAAYGKMLSDEETLKALQRRLITLWVINRQRDSLELLKAYAEALPESAIHVIRNCYYGEEKQFELYNDSKLRATIEGNDGLSLNFPDLADRVSDALYSKRLSIAKGMRELPIGHRAELTRWRNEAHKMFGALLDG